MKKIKISFETDNLYDISLMLTLWSILTDKKDLEYNSLALEYYQSLLSEITNIHDEMYANQDETDGRAKEEHHACLICKLSELSSGGDR